MRHSGLGSLLAGMLRVGTIGFGGGAALIPVMDDELVRRRGLLTSTQFGTHTLVANLTPGALPVKLAAQAGAQLGRPFGAVLAALAVALPGALLNVALLAGFAAIGPAGIRLVEFAAVGISAFIIVLMGHFMVKVIRSAGERWRIAILVLVASFLATGGPTTLATLGRLLGQDWHIALPRLSAVQVVILAIVVIAVGHLIRPGRGTRKAAVAVISRAPWMAAGVFLGLLGIALLLVFLLPNGGRFLGLVGLSTVTSFGGGEAYVAVADGFFVQSGMVDGAQFYGQTVPIANALPGPILVKIASCLGFLFGSQAGGWPFGVALAVAAFVVSVSASCIPALALLAGHEKVAGSVFVRRLGAYILPVICGLLVTTSLSMVKASMDIARHADIAGAPVGWASLAAVGLLWWAQSRWKLADLVLLAVAGGCSVTVLLILAGGL